MHKVLGCTAINLLSNRIEASFSNGGVERKRPAWFFQFPVLIFFVWMVQSTVMADLVCKHFCHTGAHLGGMSEGSANGSLANISY